MDLKKIAISSLSFLTLKEKLILCQNLDSFEELCELSLDDISKIVERSFKTAQFNGKKLHDLTKYSASLMEKLNLDCVSYDNIAEFPSLLRFIKDPPFMIFYRGNLNVLKKNTISVVGTRKICFEAAKSAFEFAKDAVLDNNVIVSGLAYGIDSQAHKGAVFAGEQKNICGTSVAVLPCGIDTIIPSSNKRIAQKILEQNGCILSEYIPGTPAENFRFVQRNRIIAALSSCVVVLQAPPASGALITAEFALDYNRDLMIHKSCLCKDAMLISQEIEKKLALTQKKNINRVEKYLEEGAPLINNYKEYLVAKTDAPGTHSLKETKSKQLNFENF